MSLLWESVPPFYLGTLPVTLTFRSLSLFSLDLLGPALLLLPLPLHMTLTDRPAARDGHE